MLVCILERVKSLKYNLKSVPQSVQTAFAPVHRASNDF